MSTLLYAAVSMCCTVAGNILLKNGVNLPGVSRAWPLNMLNIQTVAGILMFVFAMLLYMLVLKRVALNVAQSIFVIQFVLVILASNVILGEPISLLRWFGIGLIITGLVIVVFSAKKVFE